MESKKVERTQEYVYFDVTSTVSMGLTLDSDDEFPSCHLKCQSL